MQVGAYYLSPAAQATLKAHNAAVRARLEVKREERDAVAHEFCVETMSGTLTSAELRHDPRRFTGDPITGWSAL